MKQLFITMFVCVNFVLAAAQTKKLVTTIHVVENTIPDKIKVPYSAIQVLDARFDQTKIGCVFGLNSAFGVSITKTNAVFPDSLKHYLPLVLNNIIQLDSAAPNKLFILIKRFRIAEYFHNTISGSFAPQLSLNISASFYAANGPALTRLFSIDDLLSTAVISTGKELKEKRREALENTSFTTRSKAIITLLAKSLNNNNWSAADKAFVTQEPELEKAAAKRFDLPVYGQQSQQGIYASFKEFKENKPSVTNISFVYKNETIVQVLDENKEAIKPDKIWGLSDGKKRYLVFRNGLHELLPCDKSFKVLSYRTKAETRGTTNYGEVAGRGDILGGAITKLSDKTRIAEYFDLNMETGELFLEELTGTSTMAKEAFK